MCILRSSRAIITILVAGISGCGVEEPGVSPDTEQGTSESAITAEPPRPLFQAPFPCGQQWALFSYNGHDPDDRKIDMQRIGGTTPGTPVVAVLDGVVRDLGEPGGVEINHDGGWFSLYLHMTNRSVQNGQRVRQGQQIGLAGNVGTNVPHLHYELRIDSNRDQDSDNSEIVFASFNGTLYNMGTNGERAFNVTSRNCARTDDIVWQNSNGQVHYWPMLNATRQGGLNVDVPVGPDWTLRGVGDVNGDFTKDIVWQHRNGMVHYWAMRGGVRLRGVDIATAIGDWTLRGVGDVNGDGTDDIVWQHANGQVHYWRMRGGVREAGINIDVPVASEWTLRGVGDVDHNGTDDIVWQHANGQVHYWKMDKGIRVQGIHIGTPVAREWTLRGVGDVNSDGTDDIVWQHANGQVHYWRMRGGVREAGINIHTPVASDWTLRGVGNID